MSEPTPASNPRQLSLRLSLDDEATFANFHLPSAPEAGQSNNAAVVAYLQQCVDAWSQASTSPAATGTLLKEFVWLWGMPGAGCSHLLQAVCHALDARGQAVFYLSLAGWQELEPDVLQGLEYSGVLCLDEIDQVTGQAPWEEALFHLYNRMAAQQTPLLVAAGSSPQHTSFVLPDLSSRLQSAAVFQLDVLQDSDKISALQMRAARRGFTLTDEVAIYLVNRSERSMNALLTALQALDRHSLETQRKVTIPLLKSLMGW